MPNDTAPNGQESSEPIGCDICIIGGGAAGVQIAVAAAALGKKVVVVEKHKLGGESLNQGCVPSKALIAAANRAHAVRTAWTFGVASSQPHIDYAALNSYVGDVVHHVGMNSSAARLTGLGVRVIIGAGRFVSKTMVQAGETRIAARKFVIATGSSPVIPKIDGLSDIPYLTSETLFAPLRALPKLIILGAGPYALEIAQAYRRLGSQVAIVTAGRALAGEDAEMAVGVIGRLQQEGVAIRENCKALNARIVDGQIRIEIEQGGGARDSIEGSDLLIAGSRKPNISDLGLDAAGITTNEFGIVVDKSLKTRNRRVYAVGAVNGSPQSATVARDEANKFVQTSVIGLPAKAGGFRPPRVTFTDPELASAGMSEDEARAAHGRVRVLRWPYYENDRAQTGGTTEGHIKLIATMKGRLIGVSIVGTGASEMISLWALALTRGLAVSEMMQCPVPYPSLAEIGNRAALRSFSTPGGNFITRKLIALWSKLG